MVEWKVEWIWVRCWMIGWNKDRVNVGKDECWPEQLIWGWVRMMMSEKWGESMGGRLSEMCESLLKVLCGWFWWCVSLVRWWLRGYMLAGWEVLWEVLQEVLWDIVQRFGEMLCKWLGKTVDLNFTQALSMIQEGLHLSWPYLSDCSFIRKYKLLFNRTSTK